jgi:carbamoyltransferase
VCDRRPGVPVSVWTLDQGHLNDLKLPWSGPGFAELYTQCAELFGYHPGQEHRLEAVARLSPGIEAARLEGILEYHDIGLRVDPSWRSRIQELLNSGDGPTLSRSAAVASSFQRRLADLVVAFLSEIRAVLPHARLCLGGGLFYNTYICTRIAASGLFEEVFVPCNPGNAGLAAGAALLVGRRGDLATANRPAASPFLGPGFTDEQIKATLDNCKLTYEFVGDGNLVETVVEALQGGRLVAWFQDRMEWGHRALGHRSILASPFSQYVLDNLNTFLKQRERYRAYGVSVLEDELNDHFVGPARSPYMQFEYGMLDPMRFRHVLPDGATALRVQTVAGQSSLFRELHAAWRSATGCGVLVNTSFNAWSEPIVCSPRDAIRVFFGTGLDVLVLGHFVIRK